MIECSRHPKKWPLAGAEDLKPVLLDLLEPREAAGASSILLAVLTSWKFEVRFVESSEQFS